jgi:drug/metabolite transporter (DMT)-like permease
MFARAARRVGGFTLNQTRITLAFLILATIVFLTRGSAWAPGAGPHNVFLLAGSGLIGLTLGDWAYFNAMVYVGPHLATLFMTLAPPMAALLAIPLLGESLGLVGVLGMVLTLAGIVWVVLERGTAQIPRGHRLRGAMLGVIASLGQALGLVLSKLGMAGVVDPLPATAMRMGAATLGIWALALATRRAGGVVGLIRDPQARLATLAATLVGPVCGVWLSLVAVSLTKAGIAATLMATTPILVLPLVILIDKERVTRRAALGAVLSVIGIAVLFLH